jgi:PST family polysaccharide transporter
MSLKVRTARNSIVSGGVVLLLRPLNLVISIILARLLAPSDFGVVALALVLIETSDLVTSLGLGPALVQSQHERKKTVFPAFVLVMLVGLFFFSLLQAGSAQLAQFLGDPQTGPVLAALSYMILLNGLTLVPHSLLRKDLLHERISLASLITEVIYGITVVTLAYLGYGLWSIVYARLLSKLSNAILCWLFCPGWDWLIPQPWDWPVVKGLVRYGLQSVAGGLLSYFHTHWDDWLVGRSLGTQALGYYSQAYNFSNGTLGRLSRTVIGSVFFSSYAQIQNDKERLARAYLKSVHLVLLLTTPLALGLWVTAPELVSVVLGEKWLPMIPALQVYAFMILTRPVSENAAPLFQAVGLQMHNVRAGLLLVAVMVPLALLLLPYGFVGVAVAVVVSHFAGVAYNIYQMNGLLPGTALQTRRLGMPIFFASGVMVIAVLAAKSQWARSVGSTETIGGLALFVGVGVLVYGLIILFTQRDLMREVIGLMRAALTPRKQRRKEQPQSIG